jgi:hypothetical protein
MTVEARRMTRTRFLQAAAAAAAVCAAIARPSAAARLVGRQTSHGDVQMDATPNSTLIGVL